MRPFQMAGARDTFSHVVDPHACPCRERNINAESADESPRISAISARRTSERSCADSRTRDGQVPYPSYSFRPAACGLPKLKPPTDLRAAACNCRVTRFLEDLVFSGAFQAHRVWGSEANLQWVVTELTAESLSFVRRQRQRRKDHFGNEMRGGHTSWTVRWARVHKCRDAEAEYVGSANGGV